MQEKLPNTSRRRAANINDNLIFQLRDLSHVMRSLYEGRGSQKNILIVLNGMEGSVTQRELTERLGIQSGSASEVIAKLENAGYIRRTPSETDRRTADITLTEEGRAAASEAREQRLRRHEDMFSCLSDEEKNNLLAVLERINADWAVRYPGSKEHHGKCSHAHGKHRHGCKHDI